jgi:hypothetical protein
MIGETHGIHVGQTDGTTLVAEVGDVDSHGGGLGVALMVAVGAIQGTFGRRGFAVVGYFPLPAPFSGIPRDQRRGPTALTAEFGKIHVVVPNLIRCVGRFSAVFAKTEFHILLP